MAAAVDRTPVGSEALRAFARELLSAGGYPDAAAAATADLLVWANLRGVGSHGVLRIPRYVEMVRLGLIDPAATHQVEREFGAVAVLDAGRAPGAVAMSAAASKAGDLALRHGIGWCAARNITYSGAIGYHAEEMTWRGLIGIVLTASKPPMVYDCAKGDAVSTNPIAIGVPTGDRDHLLPGERGYAEAARRRHDGIPVARHWRF